MPQNIAPPGLISLLAAALAQQPTKPGYVPATTS